MNKLLLFVFAFCIVGTFADDAAAESSIHDICFKPNGLQDDMFKYFDEMVKPNSEILTPEVEEKLACALACIYEEEKRDRSSDLHSLHTLVTSRINNSDYVTEDKRKELLYIANNCKTQAGEDLCKYLKCIKVTRHPFVDVIFLHQNNKKHEDGGNIGKKMTFG